MSACPLVRVGLDCVRLLGLLAVFGFWAWPSQGLAGQIKFIGTGTHTKPGGHNDGGPETVNLKAQVIFDNQSGTMVITLSNIAGDDVFDPADVLTAVFFTLGGDPSLSRVSALLPGSSSVLFAPSTADSGSLPTIGPDVGGEWAYVNGLSAAPGGADEGISSIGLGFFDAANRFRTDSNLQGPAAPDGLQYGLTSAGDNAATGNAAVTGGNALIRDSVVFKLSGLSATFDPQAPGSIMNVFFQYGTATDEPSFLGVAVAAIPEPSTLILTLGGLPLALGIWRWQRLQRKKSLVVDQNASV